MMRVLILVLAILTLSLARKLNPTSGPEQYHFNVPGKLNVGDEIEVQGKMRDGALSFSINLVSRLNDAGHAIDINFHQRFFVRTNKTLISSNVNGAWQFKDELYISSSPYKAGDRFKILLVLAEDGTYSIVKGKSFFYQHKLPISSIKYVSFMDDHTQSNNIEIIESINFNLAD